MKLFHSSKNLLPENTCKSEFKIKIGNIMVSSFDETEYDTPFLLKKSLILSSLKDTAILTL